MDKCLLIDMQTMPQYHPDYSVTKNADLCMLPSGQTSGLLLPLHNPEAHVGTLDERAEDTGGPLFPFTARWIKVPSLHSPVFFLCGSGFLVRSPQLGFWPRILIQFTPYLYIF